MGRLNFERLGLLKLFVPELFEEPGDILYVGAYIRRFFGSGALYEVGNRLTVLEAWPKFVEELKASRFRGRCKEIVVGDVKDAAQLFGENSFDYALWFHGPEHVPPTALIPSIKALEVVTRKTVVLTCPWGKLRQDVVYDNPFTEHRGHYYPIDFARLRYRTACIGPPDRAGSQLQAWKQLKG